MITLNQITKVVIDVRHLFNVIPHRQPIQECRNHLRQWRDITVHAMAVLQYNHHL
jgi:hypothetical protein